MDLIEQKAEALIVVFQYIDNKWEDNSTDYRQALQCAIKCVEVILSTRAYSEELSGYDRAFWLKVKERLLARQ